MVAAQPAMTVERFVALWRDLGAPAAWASALYGELRRLYAEPDRRYHTPAHICHCLREFDRIRHLLRDPPSVELALWFHDAIYQLGGKLNERDSACLFLERSRGRLDALRRRRVARMILATVHPSSPRDSDTRFLVDIDLSSFALPWPEFLRDSVNVRRESTACSDAEWCARQMAFLDCLVEHPPFFFSEYYREHHEQQAQDNIRRFRALLRERPAGRPSPPPPPRPST